LERFGGAKSGASVPLRKIVPWQRFLSTAAGMREAHVARHWDENAEAWSQGIARGEDLFRAAFHERAFLRFVGPLRGKRVLDAGCGDGALTRQLARRGARVVAVDLSEKMLEVARREGPSAIDYRRGSYTRLTGLGAFDRVIAFMSLMDGPDLEGAFRSFARVLKPSGELVFAVLHPCHAMSSFGWWTGAPDGVPRMQVARYFTRKARLAKWAFPRGEATFAVPRFPRTLEDYVTALGEAGFRIDALAEPRPDAAACRRHPALALWREHAAAFLHVRAVVK
jgi:2-polyprenyl-3-methyl-5-hydroxy-6-metoxy-1,4-benzoquinol methylase